MSARHWNSLRILLNVGSLLLLTSGIYADPRTTATEAKDSPTTPAGMVYLPGGVFMMGTNDASHWPSERPAHPVQISPFWIDTHEVTNEEFAGFVAESGYMTTAETTPSLQEIMAQVPPGTPPPPKEVLVPGALVFNPPVPGTDPDTVDQWWTWTPGASWKHPEGPDSNIAGREKHPVVMVSWDDAQAYARWAGKRLPTEAEWEYAARGGLDQNQFVWGNELQPEGRPMANIWQGVFPVKNLMEDGYYRTAPVWSFPANGYGQYDMGGNVWEWCADWFHPEIYKARSLTAPTIDPKSPANPASPHLQERVIRGGSFLCHESYCSSYRPSARLGNTPDTGMSHLGFRLVKDPDDSNLP